MATILEVSHALNLTPQRVHQLVASGMPKIERGRYDLNKCMQWYVRFLQRAAQVKIDPTKRDDAAQFIRERTRLITEQADGTAMRNTTAYGDLVHERAAVRQFHLLAVALAKYAKAIPATLAAACDGQNVAERQQIIERAVHDLLDFGAAWRPGE